jgi:pimeloyl-ACP methyl ester carboxylesterase
MSNRETMLPFLLLHGAGGTATKWRSIKDHLSGTPSIAIDLPGHGKERGKAATSIEEYAALLDEKLDQDVIVVGHSMGGLVGIELALRSSKVKGLILAASHYQMPVHPHILLSLAMGKFPDSVFYASYGKDTNKDLLKEEKIQLAYNPVHVTLSDFDCCNRYTNGKQQFAQLEKPIMAIYGTQDRLVPKGAHQKLTELNPNTRIEVIENAGHYVFLEQPRQFTEAILSFRKQCL